MGLVDMQGSSVKIIILQVGSRTMSSNCTSFDC